MFDAYDNVYRLYVTEVTKGLFVLDFAYKFGARDINVITMQYIDLNDLLKQNNLHMPNDAYFLAVTHTGFRYNPHFEMETVLVTTNNFHSFEFTLIYDDDGHLVNQVLHRVYYRYGFYTTKNYVASRGGYMAISYFIPPVAEYITDFSRQVERYMLGAHTFNHTDQCAFGFNTTYDPRTNGTRIGLVIIDGVSNI
jgi:hypothetical protein